MLASIRVEGGLGRKAGSMQAVQADQLFSRLSPGLNCTVLLFMSITQSTAHRIEEQSKVVFCKGRARIFISGGG